MRKINIFILSLLAILLVACEGKDNKEKLVVDYSSEEFRAVEMNVAPPEGEVYYYAANTNATHIKDLIIKYAEDGKDDTLEFEEKDGKLVIKELMGFKSREKSGWLIFSDDCSDYLYANEGSFCAVDTIEKDFKQDDRFLVVFADYGQETIETGEALEEEGRKFRELEVNTIKVN